MYLLLYCAQPRICLSVRAPSVSDIYMLIDVTKGNVTVANVSEQTYRVYNLRRLSKQIMLLYSLGVGNQESLLLSVYHQV